MNRDFTQAQFKAAAARNGFKLGPFGLETEPGPHGGWVSYGYFFQSKPFKILRRESLAQAIAKREFDKVQKAKADAARAEISDDDLGLARELLQRINGK